MRAAPLPDADKKMGKCHRRASADQDRPNYRDPAHVLEVRTPNKRMTKRSGSSVLALLCRKLALIKALRETNDEALGAPSDFGPICRGAGIGHEYNRPAII